MGLELLAESGLDLLLDRGELSLVIGGSREVFETVFQVKLEERTYTTPLGNTEAWYAVPKGQELSLQDDLSQYITQIHLVPKPRGLYTRAERALFKKFSGNC